MSMSSRGFASLVLRSRGLPRAALSAWLLFGLVIGTESSAHAQTPVAVPPALQPLAGEAFYDIAGRPRSFGVEYAEFSSVRRYDPNYGRAALEVLTLTAIGIAQYWWAAESNSADWDWPNFSDRLILQGMRFDNNMFVTNHVLHPLAGLSYYVASRSNGLGLPGSMLFTEAASALWEGVFEWRELVSFNDMVFTPVAGIAMGEFSFHLADYLNSAPARSVPAEVAQATLGFPVRLQSWLGSRPRMSRLPKDNLGLSSGYWHRFSANYEIGTANSESDEDQWLHGPALAAELVSMPGFLRPGSFDVLFADGNFSEGELRFAFSDNGLEESDVRFSSCFAGYYAQSFHSVAAGRQGAAAMVGVGTAMRFWDREVANEDEQVALAQFVGPHFGFWFKQGGLSGRLLGDVHGDFAAIRSLPLDELRRDSEGRVLRAVFEHDYQYHLGASARLKAELAYGPLLLSGQMFYGAYRSIDGYDRREETVTLETQGDEAIARYALGAAVEPRGSVLHWGISVERDWHRSRLNEYTRVLEQERVQTSVGVVF